eukprot:CAMPEP_0174893026 /NCGR_PEP_ID=MMETSP0167-20121228/7888_1 /TAXON_ID=38298 /ORGANISM="Rhodella maculata, Strain CCMP736" /LENGTH=133 /DNA_ID=CAMNT_0016131691 /DNA_START=471 /DNA_END=869 /DNA_ORIENTATION=+
MKWNWHEGTDRSAYPRPNSTDIPLPPVRPRGPPTAPSMQQAAALARFARGVGVAFFRCGCCGRGHRRGGRVEQREDGAGGEADGVRDDVAHRVEALRDGIGVAREVDDEVAGGGEERGLPRENRGLHAERERR